MRSESGRILVIGAGWEQTPLIRAAKDAGLRVLATHPFEAEGFARADETAVIDPRDLSALLELATRRGIDAVVTDQCDYSMYAAAYLGEMLSLPAVRLDQAQLVTNKLRMRDRVAAYGGVTQPAYRGCDTIAEAEAAAKRIGYPVIVKPVDNRGNFGVTRVDSARELRGAWLEAVAHSHSRSVIVEEFIDGMMTTVEGCFLSPGRYVALAASWKNMLDGKKRVAMELVYDTEAIKDSVLALLNANKATVEALGLGFGATHSEFILSRRDGRPYFVEIHNRGGGAHIFSRIVPAVTGFDTSAHLVRVARGSRWRGPEPSFMSRGSAVLSFFQFSPGRVRGWRGEQALRRDPRVLDFRMLVKRGEPIKPITGDAFRHAFIIVAGSDAVACMGSLRDLRAKIVIDYAR